MSLREDLENKISEIFKSSWTMRDGQVVPTDNDVALSNDAVKLDATVLYADLADSTKLVDGWKDWFAAEIYKTFLYCAAKIIRDRNGVITAYDGDRVMAVFNGAEKNRNAVQAALKLNTASQQIVAPALVRQYPQATYRLRHVVGIDTSPLFVARTGIRGANDLVWVGRAANHAAKLAALPESYQTYITQDVFSDLDDSLMFHIGSGQPAWEAVRWNTFDDRIIYRSASIYSAL